MKKEMTHTITIETRKGGFSPIYVNTTVECRLLKTQIVLNCGTKYKKNDGLMVGASKYMGAYMERTKVIPQTLKEKGIK